MTPPPLSALVARLAAHASAHRGRRPSWGEVLRAACEVALLNLPAFLARLPDREDPPT